MYLLQVKGLQKLKGQLQGHTAMLPSKIVHIFGKGAGARRRARWATLIGYPERGECR